jgi:hypothetical protein
MLDRFAPTWPRFTSGNGQRPREEVLTMSGAPINGVDMINEQLRFPSAQTAVGRVSVRWRYADTLAGQEETLGPTHPETLVTKTRLAGELLNDGENAAALALLDEVRRQLRPAVTVRAGGWTKEQQPVQSRIPE